MSGTLSSHASNFDRIATRYHLLLAATHVLMRRMTIIILYGSEISIVWRQNSNKLSSDFHCTKRLKILIFWTNSEETISNSNINKSSILEGPLKFA